MIDIRLYEVLEEINRRPEPFSVYTAEDLWTDDHTSAQMLAFHLNKDIDVSSRKAVFIEQSVEWIVSRFQVHAESRIIDFGCGPGLYTHRLAECEAQVTGVDFSPRSIAYARKAAEQDGLSIRYLNRNYLSFRTDERFHLALMIMCDFCALSPAQRKSMLATFYSLLEPGGAVLLDVYSLAAFERRTEEASYTFNQLNGFWSPEPYYGFLNVFRYPDERVTLDKYTLVEKNRVRTVYNWLQYFSREQLEREFQDAGFTIEECHGDVAGNPFCHNASEFAIIATKRQVLG